MKLCSKPSRVLGAEPCPLEDGHRGVHLWYLPFQVGDLWHVVVYSGEPEERVRRCRGTFTKYPRPRDVLDLIALTTGMRARRRAVRPAPPSSPPPTPCAAGPGGAVRPVPTP